MRNLIIAALVLPALVLAAQSAGGEEPPATREQPVADAAAKKEPEFTPPPGWHPKKRGKFIVYCRKQSQMGTRLPAEVCYDEQGIRDMLAAQRDDREKVDQMRRICGSQAACGAN